MNVHDVRCELESEGSRQGLPSIKVYFSGCNMRCEYCKHGYNPAAVVSNRLDANPLLNSPKAVATAIFRYCKESWIHNLTFTGGEPMLYKSQIIDIINQLSLCNYKFRINIVTNGSIEVKDFLQEYNNSKFSEIQGNRLMFTFKLKTSGAGEYEKDICIDLNTNEPRCYKAVNMISASNLRSSIVVEITTCDDLKYAAELYRHNLGVALQFNWYVVIKRVPNGDAPGDLIDYTIEFLQNNRDLLEWRLQL